MIQKDSTDGELSGVEHEILGLPTAASPPGHKRLSCIKSCRHAEDTRLSDCQLSGDKSHALSDSALIISVTAIASCTLIEFEL